MVSGLILMLIKKHRLIQYVGIVALIALILLLEVNISFLAKGLLATPFLVIVAAAAIVGDIISSALAIIVGAMAVNYVMHPTGFKFDPTMLMRTLQFVIAGLIVYWLAFRGNTLHQSNAKLIASTKQLQTVTKRLKTQAKGNAQQIDKLNTMNDELRSLVDQFVADDEYWSRKWPLKK